MKIRVGILDSDQIYLSRLVRYFTTYYIDKVELSVFHDAEKFLEYIQTTRMDILLANPALVPEDLTLPKTMLMAYLSESSQAQKVNDVKVVYKYQRAELLYRELQGLYAELDKKTTYKETEGTGEVLFFMGAAGGVGTTTLAAACAVSLASYGKKVLYLNLEENGVIAPFLQGEGNSTLSDVLYAVKSNRSNLVLKLESMVRKSEQGVYFYEPFFITLDAHEMTEKDLKEIMDTITRYLSYDYVIVDADAAVLWKRDLLIKYARYVFVISDGKEIANQKLQRTLYEIALKDEHEEERTMAMLRVIYNRYTGRSRKADTAYQEMTYGTIEELEGRSAKKVVEEIARRPFFDRLL